MHDDPISAIVAAYPVHKAPRADRLAVMCEVYKASLGQDGTNTARLLELVRAYAAATKGADPQFIPSLANWLKEGRHLGDQALWKSEGRPAQKQPPQEAPANYKPAPTLPPPDPASHARGMEAVRAWRNKP